MTQPQVPQSGGTPTAGSDFAGRAPSQAWERLASAGGVGVWAWFKPAHAPNGVILRVPDEAYQRDPHANGLPTMRVLLDAAGIDPAAVGVWYLYGAPYDAMGGATPLLDAPIPPPMAGVDPNILVYLNFAGPAASGMPLVDPTHFMAAIAPQSAFAMPPHQGAPAGDLSTSELFDRIDADWNATAEIERDLQRLRKMLTDLFGRLKNLSRDLTPTERLHSNNQDKQDWTDARRWMREGSNKLWRCIKEHDIGDMSAAGQKKRFEQIYREFVAPRIPFDGLMQAQRDFESHRKLLQTVQSNMGSAHTAATLDGERRANQVLGRIAAKVRDAQTKRNFLGTLMD